MASDGDDDFDVERFLRLCRVPAKAVPAAAAGLRDDGFDSADTLEIADKDDLTSAGMKAGHVKLVMKHRASALAEIAAGPDTPASRKRGRAAGGDAVAAQPAPRKLARKAVAAVKAEPAASSGGPRIVNVGDADATASQVCEANDIDYVPGSCFYQVVKKESVSGAKLVWVKEDGPGGPQFSTGADARGKVGLPAAGTKGSAKIGPKDLPSGVTLFVQSTSANRKLRRGSDMLVADLGAAVRVAPAAGAGAGAGAGTGRVKAVKRAPAPRDAVGNTMVGAPGQLVPVDAKATASDVCQAAGVRYVVGACYYELSKKENISATKLLWAYSPDAGWVDGAAARRLIKAPAKAATKLGPKDLPPGVVLYVQSTSVTRKLAPGTKLLVVGGKRGASKKKKGANGCINWQQFENIEEAEEMAVVMATAPGASYCDEPVPEDDVKITVKHLRTCAKGAQGSWVGPATGTRTPYPGEEQVTRRWHGANDAEVGLVYEKEGGYLRSYMIVADFPVECGVAIGEHSGHPFICCNMFHYCNSDGSSNLKPPDFESVGADELLTWAAKNVTLVAKDTMH